MAMPIKRNPIHHFMDKEECPHPACQSCAIDLQLRNMHSIDESLERHSELLQRIAEALEKLASGYTRGDAV